MQEDAKPLDVAVIGGGIAGLIHLHCARRAGLDAVLLERAPAIGGLWRDLPAWQDIQICLADWTVGDMPIDGPAQPQVLANIEAWVDRFGLTRDIRMSCPVQGARHDGGAWVLETPPGPVSSASPRGSHGRTQPSLGAGRGAAR